MMFLSRTEVFSEKGMFAYLFFMNINELILFRDLYLPDFIWMFSKNR